MSTTHVLSVRIPLHLHEVLKSSAASNKRSINAEIIECLEQMLPTYSGPLEQAIAASKGGQEVFSKHETTPEGALVRLVPELQASLLTEVRMYQKVQEFKMDQIASLTGIWNEALRASRSSEIPFTTLLPHQDPIGIQSQMTAAFLKANDKIKAVNKEQSKARLESQVRWHRVEKLLTKD